MLRIFCVLIAIGNNVLSMSCLHLYNIGYAKNYIKIANVDKNLFTNYCRIGDI